MSYYKVATPAAIAAWDAVEVQTHALQKDAREFGALFGGIPVFQSSATHRWFTGLRFGIPPAGHEPKLWTVPTRETGYSSTPLRAFPRAKSWGANADMASIKQLHAAILSKWDEGRPTARIDKDPLITALGYDWGNLMLCGFEYFRYGDVIYCDTPSVPNAEAGGVEILGSEYMAARKALNAEKEKLSAQFQSTDE